MESKCDIFFNGIMSFVLEQQNRSGFSDIPTKVCLELTKSSQLPLKTFLDLFGRVTFLFCGDGGSE